MIKNVAKTSQISDQFAHLFLKMNASRMLSSSVRMMSTAAAKSHVPPLKIHGIVGRYAGSVYTAASKVFNFILFYFLKVY